MFFKSHYIPLMCIANGCTVPDVENTITTTINNQSLLKLPVKAIAENIAQQKFCGKLNLPYIYKGLCGIALRLFTLVYNCIKIL